MVSDTYNGGPAWVWAVGWNQSRAAGFASRSTG